MIEYDAAAGNGFCVQCGTVLEENTIVNEVSFGETSTGAAMVQGSFVGQGASEYHIHVFLLRLVGLTRRPPRSAHARMGGPFGHRGSTESREQTIANGISDSLYASFDRSLTEIIITIIVQPLAKSSKSLQQCVSPMSFNWPQLDCIL